MKLFNLDIDDLYYPEKEPEGNTLVPIDISGWSEDCEAEFERMVEKHGVDGTFEATIAASQLFEKTRLKFAEQDRPIPMTVEQWKFAMELEDDQDGENEEFQEEEEEEEAEEEDGEDDEVEDTVATDEPPAKRLKAF